MAGRVYDKRQLRRFPRGCKSWVALTAILAAVQSQAVSTQRFLLRRSVHSVNWHENACETGRVRTSSIDVQLPVVLLFYTPQQSWRRAPTEMYELSNETSNAATALTSTGRRMAHATQRILHLRLHQRNTEHRARHLLPELRAIVPSLCARRGLPEQGGRHNCRRVCRP